MTFKCRVQGRVGFIFAFNSLYSGNENAVYTVHPILDQNLVASQDSVVIYQSYPSTRVDFQTMSLK